MAPSTTQHAVMSGPAGLSLIEQYEVACQAMAHGDIKQASALAQNILKANETFAPAYALMADIAEKIGNLESASRFIDIALRFDPNQFAYCFKRGQLAYLRKEWDVCEAMFERAHALNPSDTLSLAVLGDAYAAQRKIEPCVLTFKRARNIREDVVLDEHEGLAMLALGALGSAEACFMRLLARDPNHARGRVQLAKVLVYSDRLDDAEPILLEALERNEKDHEAQYFAALWNVKKGNNRAALEHIYRAALLRDGRDDYEAMLVMLLKDQGLLADCEIVLRRILERKPDDLVALHTLAHILVPLKKEDEARAIIHKVLKQRPDDQGLKHLLNAIDGNATPAPPDTYVRDLFDQYAEKFDTHLLGSLGYRTPYAIRDLLMATANQHGISLQNLSLLDLGCGTGLGAEVFKEMTDYRVGVDLSPKMLVKAGDKQLYDGLHAANVVDYAASETRQYDLVAALDVLVYIGDLAPLFAAVHHCTASGGVFAFSVENGDDSDAYALRTSGRYAHAASYVHALAASHGFTMLAQEASVLRKEAEQDMQGWLFILRKD